jgi:Tfp pilus assembly protein PilF
MLDQLKILLGLYYQPVKAMGSMLDTGSLAFAAIAAAAVSAGLQSLTDLAPVAFLFAPAAVIIIAYWAGRGSAGVALQRDFAPMLACVLLAWAASHVLILPVAFAAPQFMFGAQIAAGAYFLVLATIAIRTIGGSTFGQAAGTAMGAAAAAVGGYLAWGQLGGIPYFFMSPFVLIMLYPIIRSNVSAVSGGLRARQNFRRNLEAATLNPHDADAQYQLGLIYQDRRNYTEAIARFTRAVEIDKKDPHPQFQLGVIAREQGRFQDALQYLNAAGQLDPKHSSYEVWRELGATNHELGQPDLARQQLEYYVGLREYDAQGLYWLGRCYKTLNRPKDACDMFNRAIEAAQTSPPHLRRQAAKWASLSRGELRSLPK